MSDVLVVQNITREGPGLIEIVLREKGIKSDVVDLSKGGKFPDPTLYKGVVVLGGPNSANDKTETMEDEVEKVRQIIDADIPYLGICLGMQVLGKAAGTPVYKARFSEVGCTDFKGNFYQVQKTQEGRIDGLLAGVDNPFKIFQLHGETIDLNGKIVLLGRGHGSHQLPHQIIKVGKCAYGVQGHLEVTEAMFRTWLEEDSSFYTSVRRFIEKNFAIAKTDYEKNGRRLIGNFADILQAR